MESESIVERVAKAIWADQHAQGLRRGLTYEDCAVSLQHQARAAISAMPPDTFDALEALVDAIRSGEGEELPNALEAAEMVIQQRRP